MTINIAEKLEEILDVLAEIRGGDCRGRTLREAGASRSTSGRRMTHDEASRLAGCGRSTIYRAINNGDLVARKMRNADRHPARRSGPLAGSVAGVGWSR